MMPVTAGPASTRRQILAYSLLLTPLALAPAFVGLGGLVYLAVAGFGGLLFMVLAVRLVLSHAGESGEARNRDGDLYDVKAGAKAARNLFAFSILYLFALFTTLLAEHLLGVAAFADLIR